MGDDHQLLPGEHIPHTRQGTVAAVAFDGDQTLAAAILRAIILHGRALPIAVGGDGQQVGLCILGIHHDHAHDLFACGQVNAPNPARRAAHAAHLLLRKANGHAVGGRQNHVPGAVGFPHVYKMLTLEQRDGANTGLSGSREIRQRSALDHAQVGGESQIAAFAELPDRNHGVDAVPGLDLDEVHQGFALGGAAGLGDPVNLQPIELAALGEHQ